MRTVLTTEHSEGPIRSADGARLGPDGSARCGAARRRPPPPARHPRSRALGAPPASPRCARTPPPSPPPRPGARRLVGVARVPRVEDSADFFTNLFLMLPTDALAVMEARFEFE